MDHEERLKAALADRYQIEREIGSGGMATVYLAQDLKHDRKVAVKVLKPELAAVMGTERFLAEIRTTANLSHPHILPLHDSGEADGFLFYVMPYVEGDTLRQRLDRDRELGMEYSLRIADQVANALAYAHSKGVIHRDIKPENVLLIGDEVVVADFGIALALDSAGGDRLTETGLSLGTPAYMSPEQVAGEKEIDPRSDIYSLACVLYEMLAGDPPFTASHPRAVLAKHLTDQAPPVTTVRPGVPTAAASAIARALQKAPADRFESAMAFAQSLFAEESQAELERTSIVVLPFDNISPDPSDAYLADGMTEELIAELSAIRDLRVISRTTAMKLKNTGKDVGTIGRDLNVQYVLEGSVRKVGNNLRITAQLIDALTDGHLSVERYSGTMDDVFDIQERMARKIVEKLEVSLRPEDENRLTTPRFSQPLAYQCYMGAKRHLGDFTQEAYDKAIKLLERALEIEGPNELLYTTMGIAQTRYSFGSRSMELVQQEAERWAARAFELNPDSAGGHALEGSVLLQQGRTQEAAKSFQKALRSDPDNTDALMWLGFIAGCAGHLDKTRSYFTRLLAVDPMAEGVNTQWISFYSGDFDEAVEGYRVEWEMDPESPYTRWAYGGCLAWAGRIQEGCEILDRIVADSPETPFGALERFRVPALRGDRDGALAAMTPELEVMGKRDVQFSWMIGSCYANLGMADEAVAWLRHAMDRGFINYPFLAEKEPFLARICTEPQVQELLGEIKERWEAFEL